MKKLLLLMLLVGCSSMTAEEKKYRYVEIYNEWQICRNVYEQSDAIFLSQLRSTSAIESGRKMPPVDKMRRDLIANKCHAVLTKVGYK